jgi:hypothetical protein
MECVATKFMHLLTDNKQNQGKSKIISSVSWPPEKIQSPATPHVVSFPELKLVEKWEEILLHQNSRMITGCNCQVQNRGINGKIHLSHKDT